MRRLAFAIACASIAGPLFAHSVVDLAAVPHVPQLLPRGATTAVEISVDVNAFDSAFGVILTVDATGSSQFAAISADPAFRCERQVRHIRCSAEQLDGGPHPVRIDLAVPASETSVHLTSVVTSIGSADPLESNNSAETTSLAYDAARCEAAAPVIAAPQISTAGTADIEWSAVPGAVSYDVLSGVDGELLGQVASTSATRARAKVSGGEAAFQVIAHFDGCPSRESAVVQAQSPAPLQRMEIASVVKLPLQQPAAVASLPSEIIVADAGSKGLFTLDRATETVTTLPIFGDIVEVPPAFDGAVASGPGDYLYFADRTNHAIRIAFQPPQRYLFFVSGKPRKPGTANGNAATAQFNSPTGIAVDSRSALFVTDTGNQTIRRIAYDGTLFDFITTTFAGAPGQRGSRDGKGADARFDTPSGIAIDARGNLIVADRGSHTIRRIDDSGSVTTIAGQAGVPGHVDGSGADALFNEPFGVAADARGNVYISEEGNRDIRKIAPNGRVTTVLGEVFVQPRLITISSDGALWIPDQGALYKAVVVSSSEPRRRAVKP